MLDGGGVGTLGVGVSTGWTTGVSALRVCGGGRRRGERGFVSERLRGRARSAAGARFSANGGGR